MNSSQMTIFVVESDQYRESIAGAGQTALPGVRVNGEPILDPLCSSEAAFARRDTLRSIGDA